MAEIEFTLNGKQVQSCSGGGARLAAVLRDEMGAKSVKIGCNTGDCGACTVLIDGAQRCACMTPLGQVQGRQVQAVSAIAKTDLQQRIQEAFLVAGATQCGICTPGMMGAAIDLLTANAAPNWEQVKDALGGVLCRCTGYQKIIDAVMLAATNEPLTLKSADGIGTSTHKVDGVPKLEGTAQYGADNIPDDALYVKVLRSPYHRATVSFPAQKKAASDFSGLTDIIDYRDIPTNRFGIYPEGKDQPVLSEGEARYRGDAVIAIVGEKNALDEYDLEDLGYSLTEKPAILGATEALNSDVPVHESHPDNILITKTLRSGEKSADKDQVSASGQFQTSFVEHAYIEPEAGWAVMQNGRLQMYVSTQAVHMDLAEITNVTGLPAEQVHLIPSECGGGFGGKLDVSIQPILAIAALRADRPVACVYDRSESMKASTKRHPASIEAEFTADRQGKLTSAVLSGVFDTGAYASWGPTVAGRVPVHGSGPYQVPHAEITGTAVYTNGPPAGAFRGFGVPQVAIAHECLMDDLADQLGLDPLEIRYQNALQAGDKTPSGQVLSHSVGLRDCLDALRPHWRQMQLDIAAFNEQAIQAGKPVRRGRGIGAMWYGIGNTSLSNPSTMEIGLQPDGTLLFLNGAVDIGQGSNTVLLQIAASAGGLPVSAFGYVMGDSDRTKDAGKTSASRQTFVSGKAAELAGLNFRENILRHVNAGDGSEFELNGERLTIRDGEVCHQIHLRDLSSDGRGYVFYGQGYFDPPTTELDENGQGTPYATYAFAAQIAEVEVDIELGLTKVTRMVAAHDVGRAINPTLVEGQVHGGIAQGLGLALMEEYIPGQSENLHDYLIPTFGDMPDITTILVEAEEPLGPYGAKGIGEPALVPTAPAIFGAIRDATGVRVTQAPMTPTRLQKAIKALNGS